MSPTKLRISKIEREGGREVENLGLLLASCNGKRRRIISSNETTTQRGKTVNLLAEEDGEQRRAGVS